MSDFVFRINPNIILGSYTVTRLGQHALEFGNRFMLIIDPVLYEIKTSDKITQSLKDRGVDYFVFSDLNESSSSKTIDRALTLAREGHIQGIIAVGGEKAINIGRAVAALFYESESLYEYIDGKTVSENPLPCICIPTTFRTPFLFTSEVPLTDARTKQIKLIKIPYSVCKLLLIDTNLMISLTENQKATITLEIFCMAVEAYLSQKANYFSEMFVEKGISILGSALGNSSSFDISIPEEVLLSQAGSMISLATSSSSLGLVSLISLSIHSRYGINKSLISSILFPYFLEDVSKYKAGYLEKIAKIMEVCPSDTGQEDACRLLIEYVRQLIARSNLPTRLKDLRLTIDQLSLAIEDISKFDIMNYLPRSMTADDLFDFIKVAY